MTKLIYIMFSILISLILLDGCGSGGGGNGGDDKNPPSATTQSASSITTTSAELHGTVNPNGLETKCWFEYGESDDALTKSTSKDSISGTSSHSHVDTISDLKPATTYYYRLYAENSDGTDKGETLQFETLSDSKVDSNTEGYAELGSGYDVFTAYADAEFVGNKVLDLDALNQEGRLSKFNVDKFDVSQHQGTTINNYVESLKLSVGLEGSYKFFSGSINTTFSKMSSVTTEWSFATVHISHLVHGLKVMKMQSKDLKNYLLQQAKDDINDPNLNPNELFDMYGTHVIGRLLVGGRLDYNLTALISDAQEKNNIGVYAEAKFDNGFASVNLNTEFDYSTFKDSYVSDQRWDLSSVGGQGKASSVWTDNDYTKWVDTVWQNPVFCDFSVDPWLIPIWELADGDCVAGSRCEEIKKAYEIYADGKTITIPEGRKQIISEILVKNTGTSDNVSLPQGYELLKGKGSKTNWINAGAYTGNYGSGDHIWIAYKESWSDETGAVPIDGIHIVGRGIYEEYLNSLIFGNESHDSQYGSSCIVSNENLNSGTCGNSEGQASDLLCRDEYVKCLDLNKFELDLHYTKGSGIPISCIVLGNSTAVNVNEQISKRRENIYWGPHDLDKDGDIDDDDADYALSNATWITLDNGDLLDLNLRAKRYWLEHEGLGCYSAYWNYDAYPQYLGICKN